MQYNLLIIITHIFKWNESYICNVHNDTSPRFWYKLEQKRLTNFTKHKTSSKVTAATFYAVFNIGSLAVTTFAKLLAKMDSWILYACWTCMERSNRCFHCSSYVTSQFRCLEHQPTCSLAYWLWLWITAHALVASIVANVVYSAPVGTFT